MPKTENQREKDMKFETLNGNWVVYRPIQTRVWGSASTAGA